MLDRTLAPPFQKTSALALPEPVIISDPGRQPIFHLTGLRQEIVKVELIFNAGKWVETKNGVSHFTSMMLEKGTATKSSVDIAASLDLYGASLEISPGFDFVSVSLYVLKSKLSEIFPLFIELLTGSSFPERELSMMVDIFRQNLKVNNEKTSFVASKLIRSKVFGPQHPYGSTVEDSDLENISSVALWEFFASCYSVHSAYILGSLGDAELKWLSSGLNTVMQRPLAAMKKNSNRQQASAPEEMKSGRTQATIRLGKKGILRNHPDYADLLLTTHLLGGFFGSRLMKNIREEKGLTYGISASLNAFHHDSLFVIGADVNKENVAVALEEIRKELSELMTTPVSEEELSLAKNHFTGSLQTDMANLFSVEEKLKTIHLNSLPQRFYHDLVHHIDAMTPETVMHTAARYFDASTLTEVVVG